MAKKSDFRKYPPKEVTKDDGSKVQFKRLNDDFPSALYHYGLDAGGNAGYQSMYPSIYSIAMPGRYGFTKLYDYIVEEYFENRGLISFEQYSLYNYLLALRNRGYYLSLKGRPNGSRPGEVNGLAKMIGRDIRWLIADLDHLEDVMFIHRVRRLDLQGQPNELVVHTPFTPEQLDGDGKLKLIEWRVDRQITKTRREERMISGKTKDGENFKYESRSTGSKFQFDYNFVKKAFGDAAKAFADFAFAFFNKFLWVLRENKPAFEADYRQALQLEMNRWHIPPSGREQCYAAAGKFRTIYCPLEEELCRN